MLILRTDLNLWSPRSLISTHAHRGFLQLVPKTNAMITEALVSQALLPISIHLQKVKSLLAHDVPAGW